MEKRGFTLRFMTIVRDLALQRNSTKSFWSIGAISAFLNGNHEILKPGNRWGDVDASSTLTFDGQCSLVDFLQQKHSGEPHPVLGVTYEQVVGAKATVFLSFAYTSDFIEMVDAIELYMASHPERSPETTYFWFDVFVNNQWTAMDKPFE